MRRGFFKQGRRIESFSSNDPATSRAGPAANRTGERGRLGRFLFAISTRINKKGKRMMRGALARIAAVLAIAVVMGCAGDKGDVNRVQPGYVTKNDFLNSSWYYRRTVVDSPEDSAWATIGTGDLFTVERIRWVVQENLLVAYRDYEYVPGAETNVDLDNSQYRGAPLAAFVIQSHFDIAREYNASTLERTNVISENTSDRPWSEREYMRVDWSTNRNPALRQIIPTEVDNSFGQGSFFVHEDDAANPYHARINPADGYIDFVVNHVVYPDYQTCYQVFDFQTNCGAGEVKVRHAFSKVDKTREAQYQPLWYPDSVALKDANGQEITDPATGEVRREPIFDRFGFYRIERPSYDEERGLTESGRVDRILRFDIWDRHTDDQGHGIPYARRTVRPIEYYLNYDFPSELRASATEVAKAWNDTFKQTVASLQGKDIKDIPDVFILHDNNCSITHLNNLFTQNTKLQARVAGIVGKELGNDTLANYCSATEYATKTLPVDQRFTWQQNGDPRFSMFYYINNITPSGFAGYGPMFGDPVSGRIISSSAYIMGWTIDDAATRAVDYVDYINGDLSMDDIIKGTTLPSMFTDTTTPPSQFLHSIDEVESRARNVANTKHLQSLESRFARYGTNPAKLLKTVENREYFAERLARIEGTAFEQEWLLRPEDLIIASHGTWDRNTQASKELYQQASLAHRWREKSEHASRAARYLEQQTFCPMAEFDGALVGLAKELKARNLTREQRRQVLKESIFKAVALHEIGHNVGLRHNFEGSYDALNFNNKFWDLENAGLSDRGKLDARQPEYKYSSIMDYSGRVNADFQGLGKYDVAAIKFGYGQLIENYANPAQIAGKDLRNWLFVNDYHKIATQVPNNTDRIDVQFDWTKPNLSPSDVDGVTQNEVPYLFCSDEYAGYTPTCRRFDFGANQREVVQSAYLKYKNYFIFSNYLRNRLTPDWNATMRGYMAFRDIITTYQYMYLYRSQQDAMFEGTPFFSTDLGKDMATATADGLNMMSEVIAMPQPGRHYLCNVSNQQVYYAQRDIDNGAIDSSQCDLAGDGRVMHVGDAEPLFLDFTDDYVTWTFRYIGTYWDKLSAIEMLTNPQATFFRVNGTEDQRAYSVSLYRIYDQEILGLFSNLIQYNRPALASDLDSTTGSIVPRKVIDISGSLGAPVISNPANMTPVWPALARNLQRMGVLYGLAWLSSPLDDAMDFAKHSRVTLKGAYDDAAIAGHPADLKPAECTLPITGYTYRAMQSRDGYSIGYEMVQTCAARVKAYFAATDQTQKEAALTDLASIEQTLQYTRLIHLIYEHGAEL
jgi:hypothetical protein